MAILQSRTFKNTVKKLTPSDKMILDQEVRNILENPDIGEEKKGDLAGVFVHKFKIRIIQYLLSYRFSNQNLELIMIGTHENYYRDLKKLIK
ncbi:MAG: addiction module toxin RelE [Candidatus Wallbacteria bacterium HGW-Wallbacteria-1]|jgi:mRNA-degrading endonuclease RelE of RelBE toxin-antitoxin system|uniref:Addiction module toxin RelE n=1 Tax=Candidatus Wallbacteria bacterium HGW-Wallbacteria-1 TaxID=2013854 RepID=A0A2N1PJR0_9BACT|nr:MAG: addiction module toxin RelE [Candidatus Wallbacteria bacterium HGW-Wallbacteria-1]